MFFKLNILFNFCLDDAEDEIDLKNVLIENGFNEHNMIIEVKSVPECKSDGFEEIMFASAKKLSKKELHIKKTFSKIASRNL